MGNSRRLILNPETRDWLEYASWTAKAYALHNNLKLIINYTYFDLYWYPPSYRQDCHNCEKVLFDALQRGKIVKNDRYILNRTQSVILDKEKPRVKIKWDGI